MRKIVARVSATGRVALPLEVRRRLGIETPGQVAFEIGPEVSVELRSVRWTLASVRGSVPALPNEMADLDAEIADAIDAALFPVEAERPRDE